MIKTENLVTDRGRFFVLIRSRSLGSRGNKGTHAHSLYVGSVSMTAGINMYGACQLAYLLTGLLLKKRKR